MSKTNSAIDNRMLTGAAIYGGVLVVVIVIGMVVVPVLMGLSVKVPTNTGKPFVDTQKVDRVYSVLMPD